MRREQLGRALLKIRQKSSALPHERAQQLGRTQGLFQLLFQRERPDQRFRLGAVLFAIRRLSGVLNDPHCAEHEAEREDDERFAIAGGAGRGDPTGRLSEDIRVFHVFLLPGAF